jgi:hypothetical protein
VSCCYEKLVAEAGNSLGTRRKEKSVVEAATKQWLCETVTG